jgi:cytochrome oxidase Cu insertion factor (SCO1/SenC/PrrC family)
MHPEVTSAKQGKCPKCGMSLRPGAPVTPSHTPGRADTAIKGESFEIPDVTVYDQNGNKLSFFSDLVKGKTVAINFIFTTCKTVCPPLTATMSRVQQELASGGHRPIQLISITVDPVTDVPERLKSFAQKFEAKPGWTFVTGTKSNIDLLLKALGAYVSDPAAHSPMVLIGNEPARYWTRAYGLARPSALRDLILQASARSSTPAAATAPRSQNQ